METREAQAQRLAIAIITVVATNLMASVLLSMDTLHRQGLSLCLSSGSSCIWWPTERLGKRAVHNRPCSGPVISTQWGEIERELSLK